LEPEERRIAREEPGPEPGPPERANPAYDRTRYAVTPAAETEVVSRFSPARRAYDLIYLVFAAICAMFILRILLKVLAANTAVAFTAFVYGVTDVLMGPFRGLLPVIANGRNVFELSALFALLVYALLGYLLSRLIAIMFMRDVTVASSTRSGRYRPD
jgi:hypothetical protein